MEKNNTAGRWRGTPAYKTPREFFESLVLAGMPDSAAMEWLNFAASVESPLYAAIARNDAHQAAKMGAYTPSAYYNSDLYRANTQAGNPAFTGEFGSMAEDLPQLAGSVGAGGFATGGGMGASQRQPYGMPSSSQKLIDMLLGGK